MLLCLIFVVVTVNVFVAEFSLVPVAVVEVSLVLAAVALVVAVVVDPVMVVFSTGSDRCFCCGYNDYT